VKHFVPFAVIAPSEDVDFDVFPQLFDVLFPLAVRFAVGNHGGHQFLLFLLPSGNFSFVQHQLASRFFHSDLRFFHRFGCRRFGADPPVQERNVRVHPVGHGPVEVVSVSGDVHWLNGWRRFLREEDEPLVRLAIENWPFSQPKFVVEIEDDGVVGVEWPARILMRTVDDFAVADWASVLDKSVVPSAENSHLGSPRRVPEEDRFDFRR
jgi:hypothetical protein